MGAVPPGEKRCGLAEAAGRAAVALQGVAQVQVHARAKSTQDRIARAARELQKWCDGQPAELGLSVQTVGPSEVLWYMQEHWTTKHQGEVCVKSVVV